MKTELIVNALRCSASSQEPKNCGECPYMICEKLPEELQGVYGLQKIESCDVDQIALDAAERLEELSKQQRMVSTEQILQ